MLACWSVNGGVGTTVVVAGLAVASRSWRADEVLVADLGGDLPTLFGAAIDDWPGISGWLQAGPDVPDDALVRLEREVAPGIHVLPRGVGPLDGGGDGADRLIARFQAEERPVIVDVGVLGAGPDGRLERALVEAADRTLLLTRACPLALRRLAHLPAVPDGVVVVRDRRRAVTWEQVAEACAAPVLAELEIDPAVGAAVDADLAHRSLPRRFVRVLETVL